MIEFCNFSLGLDFLECFNFKEKAEISLIENPQKMPCSDSYLVEGCTFALLLPLFCMGRLPHNFTLCLNFYGSLFYNFQN